MTVLQHGPEPELAGIACSNVIPSVPIRRRAVPSLLATAFGWCAPQVNTLAEADPLFEPFLLRANRLQFHLIAMAVALAMPDPDITPHDAKPLAALLRLRKVATVAEAVCGWCPPGLRGALWKLPKRPLSRRGYRRLIELLNEPAAARVLHQSDRITPLLLAVLARIDPALRRASLVREIKSLREIEELEYAACALQHLGAASDRAAALAQLGAANSLRDIAKRLAKAFDASRADPDAWPGSDRLKLLQTLGEVRRTAREFQNCLVGIWYEQVWRQQRQFYVWRGECPAMVALADDAFVGWQVAEIRGTANAVVPAPTSREILRDFAAAGIRRWRHACAENWLCRVNQTGGPAGEP